MKRLLLFTLLLFSLLASNAQQNLPSQIIQFVASDTCVLKYIEGRLTSDQFLIILDDRIQLQQGDDLVDLTTRLEILDFKQEIGKSYKIKMRFAEDLLISAKVNFSNSEGPEIRSLYIREPNWFFGPGNFHSYQVTF